MTKNIKRIISILMVITMTLAASVTCFAAECDNNATETKVVSRASTLHKVNGIYKDNGASDEYTTTLSRTCSEIRVKGITYDSVSAKLVNVHIYREHNGQELLVASLANVRLDNNEYTMFIYNPFVNNLYQGTYTVRITTSDTKPYEVSTYVYY